jgi:tRNA 2-thiouridine synthesizing protein A
MDPSPDNAVSAPTSPVQTLDTSGTFCPVPIIETARVMGGLAPGQQLRIFATDPGIESDLPAWCRSTRNRLLALERHGSSFQALIEKV